MRILSRPRHVARSGATLALLCALLPALAASQRYVPPADDAAWARVSPAAAGFDPMRLDSAIAFAKSRRELARLIIRRERIAEVEEDGCRHARRRGTETRPPVSAR